MKKKIRWKINAGQSTVYSSLNSIVANLFSLKIKCFWLAIFLILFHSVSNQDANIKQDSHTNSKSGNLNNLISTEKNGFLISHLVNTTIFYNESLAERPEKKLHRIDCRNLRIGHFYCPPVEIDSETQQPKGCTSSNLAPIKCILRDGLICDDDIIDTSQSQRGANTKRYVQLAVACEYTNGYSYEIALLLSIFLGMFGVDRFYLGYPAIGLLKFCTLGFLFLGQFIDIILISMQIVRPADNSHYIIKYFGPKLNIIKSLGLNDVAGLTDAEFVTQSAFDIYFYYKNGSTILS